MYRKVGILKNMSILDLTKNYPRSGRERIGGFAWLGRAADKARAKQAGTLGEYVSLCPMDSAFLERCGVMDDTFVDLIRGGATDDALAEHFERYVSAAQRDAANHWVLIDMASHLEEQDREEGRQAA